MEKVEIKVDKKISNKVDNIYIILLILMCVCLGLGIGGILIGMSSLEYDFCMVGTIALLSAIPLLVLARLFLALEYLIQTCEILNAINKEKYTIKNK